ncbi:MAG: hypothetical protein JSS72_08090 [Armatimonadetes bacterium]|nr:hypothetical protein [Armatimonadota bacterium]
MCFEKILLFAILAAPPRQPSTFLRLQPGPGSSFVYKLHIDRVDEHRTGDLYVSCKVRRNTGKQIVIDGTLTKFVMNGKDLTAKLKGHGKLTGTLPYNERSERIGNLDPMGFDRTITPQMFDLLKEVGIYLGNYPAEKVTPGYDWSGETTATGGCTYCDYKLKGFSKSLDKAYLEVTNIRLRFTGVQDGPMTMEIDMKHGIPTTVSYQVRSRPGNKLSRFKQTLVSFKPGS